MKISLDSLVSILNQNLNQYQNTHNNINVSLAAHRRDLTPYLKGFTDQDINAILKSPLDHPIREAIETSLATAIQQQALQTAMQNEQKIIQEMKQIETAIEMLEADIKNEKDNDKKEKINKQIRELEQKLAALQKEHAMIQEKIKKLQQKIEELKPVIELHQLQAERQAAVFQEVRQEHHEALVDTVRDALDNDQPFVGVNGENTTLRECLDFDVLSDITPADNSEESLQQANEAQYEKLAELFSDSDTLFEEAQTKEDLRGEIDIDTLMDDLLGDLDDDLDLDMPSDLLADPNDTSIIPTPPPLPEPPVMSPPSLPEHMQKTLQTPVAGSGGLVFSEYIRRFGQANERGNHHGRKVVEYQSGDEDKKLSSSEQVRLSNIKPSQLANLNRAKLGNGMDFIASVAEQDKIAKQTLEERLAAVHQQTKDALLEMKTQGNPYLAKFSEEAISKMDQGNANALCKAIIKEAKSDKLELDLLVAKQENLTDEIRTTQTEINELRSDAGLTPSHGLPDPSDVLDLGPRDPGNKPGI